MDLPSLVAAGLRAIEEHRHTGSLLSGKSPMAMNSGRRTFLKQSLSVLSSIPLASCGGGGGDSGGPNAPASSTTPAAPSIEIQPSDHSALVGETATFVVVADGTPPPSYLWQRDGIDIPGATGSSYTTAALSIGDDDTLFAVVVSNDAGSTRSRDCVLTVFSPSVTVDSTTIGVDSTAVTVDSL